MRTIFVPLFGSELDQLLLELSGCAARLFGSHISAVYIRPSVVEQVATQSMGAGAISPQIWDTLAEEERVRERDALDHFQTFCSARGIPIVAEPVVGPPTASWLSCDGAFTRTITRLGRYCDLIAVGRGSPYFHLDPDHLGELLVQAGRPILIAPKTPCHCKFEVIAIAWKDTAQSAHAMTAANAFLGQAKKVFILQAEEEGAETAAAEALAQQSRWGIRDIEVRSLAAPEGKTARAIVSAATSLGVDLLVAGGYGHSRAREFVLGGVTRALLEDCPLPVLIAH
jgi:nucleotide-binding universal stress UspA family protein